VEPVLLEVQPSRLKNFLCCFVRKTPIFTRKNYPFIYKSIGWHFGGLKTAQNRKNIIFILSLAFEISFEITGKLLKKIRLLDRQP